MMQKASLEIFIIIVLGLLSFVLTIIIKKIALKRSILAIPNSRSLHDQPTPKGGGIAIVVSWYVGITIFFFLGYIDRNLFLALLCGIILAIVSMIDDIKGLSPIFRLIVQFVSSVIAFYLIGDLRPLVIPGIHFDYNYISYPFAIIGMVWFINLYNFMDGIDGFASLEAIIVSLALLFFTHNVIFALLFVSVAGFLYWNWPKAKIFMGDVGSTQLGFILVVLGIYFHNSYKFSILNWIMLLSPFWFDATLTLYRRWRNHEKLNVAHKKHIYQRLVQAGFTHLQVDLVLILVNFVVLLIILVYREFKFLQIPLFALTILTFYFLTRIVDKKKPF